MKIALFGQYYQNSTAEIVHKVVDFLESNGIAIAFEINFMPKKIFGFKSVFEKELEY